MDQKILKNISIFNKPNKNEIHVIMIIIANSINFHGCKSVEGKKNFYILVIITHVIKNYRCNNHYHDINNFIIKFEIIQYFILNEIHCVKVIPLFL
jgi:hypothetical protein